jgi:GNAT superfamily N-acetyltransferase
MVPLDDRAIERVMTWDLGEVRALSLRHALIYRRPGLLGDHPRSPRSVLLVREVGGPEGSHVFGAGIAEPAIGWLAKRGQAFSLLAPDSWEGAIRRRSTSVLRGVVETWVRPENGLETHPPSAAITTRRLVPSDADAFAASAPDWALRGWGDFSRLLELGAAIGVPTLDGRFASLAWIFEADHGRDSLAVATDPRFRRLGLGRAAALSLIESVEADRKKAPIWTVNATNLPSKALARSLGFSPRSRECVLRWLA